MSSSYTQHNSTEQTQVCQRLINTYLPCDTLYFPPFQRK